MDEEFYSCLGGATTGTDESFLAFPDGYQPGRTKYLVVTGTVISGLGKGIAAASVGRLLKMHGLRVSAMKFDGYLNLDAGTLNPFRHGEVFVLDDGTECDMDLGTYERYLDENLSRSNYMTAGKLFDMILKKERAGEYLGRDVQFIPHVTGEIKNFIRRLAMETKADVLIIEVGGTVGDIENSYCIEAMRELVHDEGRQNVCFMNLTYVPEPASVGEQKSKPAQLGIRALMAAGIQPDMIVCRSERPTDQSIKDKISVFSNVPVQNVVDSPDLKSVYEVPLRLQEEGLDMAVLKRLGFRASNISHRLAEYKRFVDGITRPERTVNIAITGKYTKLNDSYASILCAIEHAGAHHKARVNVKWVETTDIEDGKVTAAKALEGMDGIIVPGGFGKRGVEGKIKCVEYARTNKIPFLGLCYGFQMAVIEYSRNVCGLAGANTTEVEPDCKHAVVKILPGQQAGKVGATMRLGGRNVLLRGDTKAFEAYGESPVRERFRHRFECNPDYVARLEEKGLVFSGRAPAPEEHIMQVLELKDHPFFVASQFHPEYTSRPTRPNPLYRDLIGACLATKR